MKKRGKQGQRTDLKTVADRERNKRNASKGGTATATRGTGNYFFARKDFLTSKPTTGS